LAFASETELGKSGEDARVAHHGTPSNLLGVPLVSRQFPLNRIVFHLLFINEGDHSFFRGFRAALSWAALLICQY
jgi:hypothetical protein